MLLSLGMVMTTAAESVFAFDGEGISVVGETAGTSEEAVDLVENTGEAVEPAGPAEDTGEAAEPADLTEDAGGAADAAEGDQESAEDGLILEETGQESASPDVPAESTGVTEQTEATGSIRDFLVKDTDLYAPMTNLQVMEDPTESNLYILEHTPSEEECFDEILVDPEENAIYVDGDQVTETALQPVPAENGETEAESSDDVDADEVPGAGTPDSAGKNGEDTLVQVADAGDSGETAETAEQLTPEEKIDTLEEKESVFLAVAKEAETTAEAEEILEGSPYEVTENADGTLSLEAPYQLQSVVVYTEDLPYSYGSVDAVYDPEFEQYVLLYADEADAMNGYHALQADGYEVFCNDFAAETLGSSFWTSYNITTDNTPSVAAYTKSGTDTMYGDSYSKSVKVAFVDTGVSSTIYNYFSGRFAGAVSVVDSYPTSDIVGHGSEVSSVILTNTPTNVKLYSVKVSNTSSAITYANICSGLKKAIKASPNIINISLGGYYSGSDPYKSIISKGRKKGIVFVAGAGNDGKRTGGSARQFYPAGSAGVNSVSGITLAGKKDAHSNYGPATDFCSYYTMPVIGSSGTFAVGSGTSFSSPLVCAELADIMSLKNCTANKAVTYGKRITTDYGASGKDEKFGYGLIKLGNPFTIKVVSSRKSYTGKKVYSKVKLLTIKGTTYKTVKKNTKTSKYTVTYSNNIKVGKAKVTAKIRGVTIKKYFSIVPTKPVITAASRTGQFFGGEAVSFTLKWKKKSAKMCKGYQVQVATDAAFTNFVYKKTLKKNTKTSVKMSSLSNYTYYYVRLRTYKIVNKKTYASGWKTYRLYTSYSYPTLTEV